MADKTRETPESLFKFFQELAPSGSAEDEDIEVHYGSSSVIRRGLEAAKMLITIQQVMGVKNAPAEKKDDGSAPAASGEIPAEITERLTESKAEIDRLLLQNMEINKANAAMKDKIQFLQKQVERLYNKNEMAKTLKTIETKKMSAAEQADDAGNPDAPDGEGAEGESKRDPSKATIAPKTINKELAEAVEIESAARAPKEEEAK